MSGATIPTGLSKLTQWNVHTCTSRWPNGGGENFPQGKIFENFFGGGKVFLPPKKNFPTPFFVKFDEIIVYLDAKT